MKKILASAVLVAFIATGCTGSFNLTKKVNNFHRSQSDKWSDELCFLLVALTPIYGLAMLGDAIIFNSIEFWTGDNPIALNSNPDVKVVRQGDDEMIVSYNKQTDQIIVAPKLKSQEKAPIILERNDQMVMAKNEKGQVLFSSMKNDQGDIAVYNGSGELIKNYSADEVQSLKDEFLKK